MGRTCVCGAEAIDIDAETRIARVKDVVIDEGDVLSIDGSKPARSSSASCPSSPRPS